MGENKKEYLLKSRADIEIGKWYNNGKKSSRLVVCVRLHVYYKVASKPRVTTGIPFESFQKWCKGKGRLEK